MDLTDALRTALAARPSVPEDAAAVELARTYAQLISNAAPAAKYRKALRWLAGVQSEDEKAAEYADLIATALSEHSVASDLGPKFLAALEALEMSPRARAAGRKAVTDDKPNPLDQLAARRAGKGRAEAVDATAT